MIFSENTQVIYKNMQGIIRFVCDKYVVIEITAKKAFSAPGLLVFREDYEKIEILKASTK
jgi:hypothetical protein